jgi:hypothetical protein
VDGVFKMNLTARFRRARMKAAKTVADRASKDGDQEAAEVWAARSQRWSPEAADKSNSPELPHIGTKIGAKPMKVSH